MRRYRIGLVELCGLLAVTLVPLVFNPWSSLPFEKTKVTLLWFLVATMALSGLLWQIGSRPHPWRSEVSSPHRLWLGRRSKNPLLVPILIFGAVHFLATVTSVEPGLSAWGLHDGHGTLTLLVLIAFSLVLARALHTAEQAERLVTALLLGSIPVSIYGIIQYLGLDPLLWVTDSVSPVLSTLGRSNFVGAYLAVIMPFTMARFIYDSSRRRSWSWRFGALFILQIFCLFLSLARAAWLAFLGASLVFTVLLSFRSRRAFILVVAGMATLVIGLVFQSPLAEAVTKPSRTTTDYASGTSIAEMRAESIHRRFIIWSRTSDLIPGRWLLGYGPESFEQVFTAHYPPNSQYDGLDSQVNDPHNLILRLIVDAGVAGLLAWLFLVAALYRLIFLRFRNAGSLQLASMAAAIPAALTAYLIQAQFNPDAIALETLFWLLVALGVVVSRLVEEDSIPVPS